MTATDIGVRDIGVRDIVRHRDDLDRPRGGALSALVRHSAALARRS